MPKLTYFWPVPKETKGLPIECRFIVGMFYAYTNGKEHCYPSQKTIANELGCSVRQVRRYLNELEKQGWIVVFRRGKQRTNLYKLADMDVPSHESDRTWVSHHRWDMGVPSI